MITVKLFNSLDENELAALSARLVAGWPGASPYHYLEYARVIDEHFQYPNLSLAAFDQYQRPVGWLPQWRHGCLIESVPWRDRGGPLFDDPEVLNLLLNETKALATEHGCRGLNWKDFSAPGLTAYEAGLSMTADLTVGPPEVLWRRVEGKNIIRQAEKNGLIFRRSASPAEDLPAFYEMFEETRRRLGVPAYSPAFFQTLFRCLADRQAALFFAVRGEARLAGLICLMTPEKMIYAFGASNEEGRTQRANNFVLWQAQLQAKNWGLGTFDFGTDSLLQTGLLKFKEKLGGCPRKVFNAHWGRVKEMDHNRPLYAPVKMVMSHLPRPLFRWASRQLVK